MVDKRKSGTAVNGARFGVKAGTLLLGIFFLASCSMFGEESGPPPGPEPSAEVVSSARVNPDAPGVADGLPPDIANQQHDSTVSRRPVTTIRPLEDEPVNAEMPSVTPPTIAPQSSTESTVDAAPVEAVESAPKRTDPVSKPEPRQDVAEAPESSERQDRVLVSRGGAEAENTGAANGGEAPTPALAAESVEPVATQPYLTADTTALDQAAAHAYGGVVARPPQMQSTARAQALIPQAVVGVPRGSGVAGGPVVIGGATTGVTMVGGFQAGGPVVIGGDGGVVPAISSGTAPIHGHSAVGEPVAVIQFDFGSSALDARDRRVLRQVADLQARHGGFIKVVGHSSLFTANMPQDRHMLVNFTTSVARAEAVARGLQDEGVPPEVIDVAAVGDREPLYQEVMPAGEAGNRRVEIFLIR